MRIDELLTRLPNQWDGHGLGVAALVRMNNRRIYELHFTRSASDTNLVATFSVDENGEITNMQPSFSAQVGYWKHVEGALGAAREQTVSA